MGAKAIIPKSLLLEPEKLMKAINNAMDGAAEAARVDFYSTTDTFKTVKPKFRITKRRLNRIIATDNRVYGFLNDGTPVRYAVMSPDFRAKTKTGFIGSRIGRGRLVIISKKIKRPGIKPRKFAETIAKKWQKELPKIVQRSIDSTVR